MRPSRFLVFALALAAVCLTAATCNKEGQSGGGGTGPESRESKGQKPPPDPASEAKAAQMLSGIPGMDFSILPSSAQKELAAVMTDEFCYCGCPHTLLACLKTHASCKHARRMARLAAGEAAAGAPSTEIIVDMQKYYLSFKDPRRELKVNPRQCMGSPEAKVTVVEFSDFECPFCAAARPVLEQFAKDNGQKVRLCYAPFPLASHPNAIPAGQAALFARDQGKFWEMHDALFENQSSLSVDEIKQLAQRVGLSAAELQKVFASNKYADELNAMKELGKTAGVNSTPSLYVNGRKVELPLSAELLAQTVEDELEWTANNGWAAD